MGCYYGVRAIIKNGERIGVAENTQPELNTDSALIAIVSNDSFAIAADVTSEREYEEVYISSQKGSFWNHMELYILHKDDLKKCPDEGRVSTQEVKRLQKPNLRIVN